MIKSFKIGRLIFLILVVIMMTSSLLNFTFSYKYYPDIEMAVKNQSRSEKNSSVALVTGEEGMVSINLCDYNTVGACNFYTRSKNGTMLYRVAKERGLTYIENCMVKMNTAPNSTEQIVIGIGEKLAKECSEKTGISVGFINLGNNGQKYRIWYIISTDGLDKLPDLQLQEAIFEKSPSKDNYIGIGVSLGIVLAFVVVVWKLVRNKKKIMSNRDD